MRLTLRCRWSSRAVALPVEKAPRATTLLKSAMVKRLFFLLL
ncbi:hypothetical protein EVA_17513 [gut metagenome]|uniref:Uncharacterized protein n=1 Tax=gut metagenome TaxID=749906 RepID=J9C3I2_9ZZZZ